MKGLDTQKLSDEIPAKDSLYEKLFSHIKPTTSKKLRLSEKLRIFYCDAFKRYYNKTWKEAINNSALGLFLTKSDKQITRYSKWFKGQAVIQPNILEKTIKYVPTSI